MKVSKVVLIVVALHVLVIGGIFIFEGCSRTRVQSPEMAATEEQPGTTPDAAVAPVDPLAALPAGLTPATPDAAAGGATLAPAPGLAPAAPAAASYAVKKGDSLWKIAKAEGTTVDELLRANNLTKSSVLQIGQKLTVSAKAAATADSATLATTAAAPVPEAGGDSYTVKSGDSLWKIATQKGISVASLKQANSLSSDKLQIGQKLTIPAKTQTVTAAAPAAPVRAALATSAYQSWEEPGTSFVENGQTIHIIDFNESLGMIAAKYGVSTKALMTANRIADARNIHPGQRLVIPSVAGAVAPSADLGLAAPVVQTTASAR